MVITKMKAVHWRRPAPPAPGKNLKDPRGQARHRCIPRHSQNQLLGSLARDSEMQRFGFSTESPPSHCPGLPLGQREPAELPYSDLKHPGPRVPINQLWSPANGLLLSWPRKCVCSVKGSCSFCGSSSGCPLPGHIPVVVRLGRDGSRERGRFNIVRGCNTDSMRPHAVGEGLV